MRKKRGNAGFALIGSLLVVSLATALLAVVQRVAPPKKASAPQPTLASILAEQKLEQLRGLIWGFDGSGLLVLASELLPSPEGALQQDTTGYVDYLDARGVLLEGGMEPPTGTRYVRRWSIEPLRTNPENSLVIRVLVNASQKRDASEFPARLTMVKTRKAVAGPLAQ